ncbi:MAG: murein biosynthesis integral membrane protein MurJ [Oscillospiraceae bacterium]|nr:murein biosynthesis integral membrane protein MurJ [Oscillospiraceae bacterium]
MSNRDRSKIKTVSLVIIITFIGKAMGLGRDTLMAHTFGTGLEADALMAAIALPQNFFDAIFASAVSASFIPVFNEVMQREGREEADRLASSFFTLVGLTAATLTFLGMIFAPSLVELVAANFDPERAALAARLLRIIFPSLFFTGIAFSMVGMLNSFGEFNIPAAMSVASNGILIIYFLFFVPYFGVYGAAAALLIGWAAQAVMQIPSLRKQGYRYRPRLRHPGLGKIFRLMLPVMVSAWVLPINMLVSTRFASGLSGGVASVHLANRLYIVIVGILVLSVTNVIFPEMSRLSAAGERTQFRTLISTAIHTLLFLLIPMTVGLMVLATPLIQLLFEHRQFDAESTHLTASALFFMSIGMVGYGMQNVLIRAFYAEKKGKLPLVSSLIAIIVNLLLCILLVDRLGVGGIALASAVSLSAAAAILAVATHRQDKNLFTGDLWQSVLKIGVSAAVMGAVVILARDLLSDVLGFTLPSRMVVIFVPMLLGATVYFALAILFKLPQMAYVVQIIKRR